MTREELEKKIRNHGSGFCRHHVKQMIDVLRAEGWGNKVSILAAVRDWASELLFGNSRPVKLRPDQREDVSLSCDRIIRFIRQQVKQELETGGVDNADNRTETASDGHGLLGEGIQGA